MSSRCLSLLLVAMFVGACQRDAQPVPPAGQIVQDVRQIPLRPGTPTADPIQVNPYTGDPRAVDDGKRLYHWMNCSGCHFEGGGGIGPPLLDEEWIYGGRPAQIFDTVVNGRPNGMPAYGDKLVADEIWRIVAYVDTLDEGASREGSGSGGAGNGGGGNGGGGND